MSEHLYIIVGTAYLECDEEMVKNRFLKNSVSVSNTVFERKLFSGFKDNGANIMFLSCPHLGYFPTSLKKLSIKGLTSSEDFFTLKYNALLGFAGLSKAKAFKRKLSSIKKTTDPSTKIHLIVCEMHKPYLDAAKFAKKTKIVDDVTLLVPDLPEHNVRSKNPIYKSLKRKNVSQIYNLVDSFVDKFVFFSSPMVSKINTNGRNYIINEGISNCDKPFDNTIENRDGKKHIVFIGKLDNRNGIQLIYNSAKEITDDSIVFDLYGVGGTDLDASKITELKNVNNRGFLKPSDVKNVLREADILLSPRFSNDEYTKYSFPSKMFDYLESGKPIITFKLESYPAELDELVYYPESETSESLTLEIQKVLTNDEKYKNRIEKYSAFLSKYNKRQVAAKIIELINK